MGHGWPFFVHALVAGGRLAALPCGVRTQRVPVDQPERVWRFLNHGHSPGWHCHNLTVSLLAVSRLALDNASAGPPLSLKSLPLAQSLGLVNSGEF